MISEMSDTIHLQQHVPNFRSTSLDIIHKFRPYIPFLLTNISQRLLMLSDTSSTEHLPALDEKLIFWE